jgi:hypothetical protein
MTVQRDGWPLGNVEESWLLGVPGVFTVCVVSFPLIYEFQALLGGTSCNRGARFILPIPFQLALTEIPVTGSYKIGPG